MNEHSPYSLKPSNGNSDAYYRTIAGFADRWLAEAQQTLHSPVASFQAFLAGRALGDPGNAVGTATERSFSEIAFEMLVLGVLLREHGAQALNLPPAPAWMLAKLVETQDRLPLPPIEKPIKAMRGLLQGLVTNDDGNDAGECVDNLPFAEGAAGMVGRLVAWLRAEGQAAQAERMMEWCEYLARLDEQRAQAILARCLLLAEDFAAESEAALGAYTTQVGEFVTCVQAGALGPRARWRYDAGLITRTRSEYHLGMLGTEILSRAYRARFLAAPRKVVVVPDCLCAHSRRAAQETETSQNGQPITCQAARTALGGQCQGCTAGCKVRALTRLGEKHGFEVYILPDDLRGIGLGSCSRLSGIGVVGISCALTNWDAGWQVSQSGIPAQGVLLDYAGCRSHWSETGIPTDVNIQKLLQTIADKEPALEKKPAP